MSAEKLIDNHLCELCEKNPGAYSESRRMRVCENCWQAMGRQEIAFQQSIGVDFTGQDSEVE